MKRRLIKLVVFLILGAVVNVAAAWWLARSVHLSRSDATNLVAKGYSSLSSDGAYWRVEIREEFGSIVIIGSVSLRKSRIRNVVSGDSGLLPTWSTLRNPPEEPDPKWVVFEEARGWPLRALACEQWRLSGPSGYFVVDGFDMGQRPFFRPPPRIALPYRPLWPGFAINTTFYAAILWLPFAPFHLRRYVRVKRGCCIQCGYDLRSDFSSGCPECGWQREDVS